MNSNSPIYFYMAMVSLVAWVTFAQAEPGTVTNDTESLRASSAYGEATVIRNIAYVEHPTSRQNFDLYLPGPPGNQPFPFILWVHGGAWMMGIKEWDNVKYLVRHGYAIASIDYRISTTARFPAQIQDCNAALNFILAHAQAYGVDPRRFIVGGASAGGHLALLLGLARHEKAFGADPAAHPLAILDFFGPTDLNNQMGDLETIHSERGIALTEDAGAKLLGGPIAESQAKAKAASPINYVSATSPPVLIIQGGKDDLVPVAQSRRLQTALERAGVKNQFILVETAGHDGPQFSTPDIESKVTDFINAVLNQANH